jgi:hypothetical protein
MRHLEPEDILRQALRAAAETVEPAPEGLTQIRARLSAPRPLAFAWLLAGWETASQFVTLRLEAALDWLASSLHTALRTADGLLYPAAERLRPLTERLQPLAERLRPALAWLIAAVAWLGRMIRPAQAGSEERRSRYAWARPAIAMAAVVLVAVVGGFALSGQLNVISQSGLNVFSSGGQQANGNGGGTHNSGVNGNGTHLQPSSGPSGKSGASPTPTTSCRPKAKPKAHPRPTPTPTVTPTQSVPSSPPPSSPPPSSPPPSSPPPSSPPPPTSGPEQGTSPAPATQSAQVSAVVIIGARSGSASAASPTPSPRCSPGGS